MNDDLTLPPDGGRKPQLRAIAASPSVTALMVAALGDRLVEKYDNPIAPVTYAYEIACSPYSQGKD